MIQDDEKFMISPKEVETMQLRLSQNENVFLPYSVPEEVKLIFEEEERK
jgi:hypothetical protein